jgi:CPA2 family monovalent cation:H+ antiporter-2
VNPLIFRTLAPIERWLRGHPRIAARFERPAGALADLPAGTGADALEDHVVLVGHGRVGGPVAEALEDAGITYLVVEQNREAVEALRARGLPVIYGDASRPTILEHAYLSRARLLVVAAPDPVRARLILEKAREVNPAIDAVVRTHSDADRRELESRGAGRAVVGERELALAIIRYAYGSYGIRGNMAEVAARTLRLLNPHSGRSA